MSQNTELEEKPDENYDFSELDLAIRRWAAQTGHDTDQDWYRKMKEMYE